MVILKTPTQQLSFQEVVSRDRQKNRDSDEEVWTVDYWCRWLSLDSVTWCVFCKLEVFQEYMIVCKLIKIAVGIHVGL